MGIDSNLVTAAKNAVREAIAFLVTEKGMTREDAYMLSSVAVDFNMTELVDGTVGVHGLIPKNIFAREAMTPAAEAAARPRPLTRPYPLKREETS